MFVQHPERGKIPTGQWTPRSTMTKSTQHRNVRWAPRKGKNTNWPPNFEDDFRRLVPLGPQDHIDQTWLNDTLLSVGVKHIRAEMPDPSGDPQAGSVPACICILDGFVATNLLDSQWSDNFNRVLRWLQAQCTLATVRHFLMPASVKTDSDGNYILSRAND